MLTPANSLIQGSPILSPARQTSTPPAQGASQPTNVNTGRAGDQLNLSQTSQNRNPYQGVSPSFSTVKVDSWGQGRNDSVVQILLNQGYTQQEIYGKSGNGKSLLDEVTRVNGLRNANLIRAGQDLVVPSKEAAQAPQAEAQAPPQQSAPETRQPETRQPETRQPETRQPEARTETPRAETTQTESPQTREQNEARVNQVRVDRWGQGPNSSLGAILRGQGFDDKQIFREDSNGDSLLKKVARANGLESPDRILAGSTLKVPNSMEALQQMNIPAMPARTEAPRAETPRTETPGTETPRTEPPRTETPRVEPPARTETETPRLPQSGESEPTANMGMLLDGIKQGKFNRQEFQYLNARSSRYTQMRARFAHDGYSNDELSELGRMERRYGVEFARLAESDNVRLPEFPANSNGNPDLAIQIKHYHESGPLFDGYSNGSVSSENAIQRMVRQRDEARRQEAR